MPLTTADLTAHLACAHVTQLENAVRAGEAERPEVDDPWRDALLDRHHQLVETEVRRRADGGGGVVMVDPEQPWAQSVTATEAAMRSGASLIVRPRFQHGRWRSDADLLVRVERPTQLGRWGYEPVIVSMARRLADDRLLRLAAASEAVATIQGGDPPGGEARTSDGRIHRPDLTHPRRRLQQGRALLAVAVDGPPAFTRPDPVPHCRRCHWLPVCVEARHAADDITTVAGVRAPTAAALRQAGVTTASALASRHEPVPDLDDQLLSRLRRQAELQLAQRADGAVRYELLEPAPERGLTRLPSPAPGDIFFDIEGAPWAEGAGREYLFGLLTIDGGQPRYQPVWAHDRQAEGRALREVVDRIISAWREHPGMHVYHYASYEPTALRTLARRHGTRRRHVEAILRAGIFVDLYDVVKGSVLVSQDGYGLKKLEPLYRGGRSGAVADGPASVLAYEQWQAHGDPGLLDDLADYNELDCESTLGLRDWLESRRSELEAETRSSLPRPSLPAPPPGRWRLWWWRLSGDLMRPRGPGRR